MPGGAYRFLYIEDVNGKKTIYLFDSGIIGYKKGKEFYIVSNKNIIAPSKKSSLIISLLGTNIEKFIK